MYGSVDYCGSGALLSALAFASALLRASLSSFDMSGNRLGKYCFPLNWMIWREHGLFTDPAATYILLPLGGFCPPAKVIFPIVLQANLPFTGWRFMESKSSCHAKSSKLSCSSLIPLSWVLVTERVLKFYGGVDGRVLGGGFWRWRSKLVYLSLYYI